MSRPEIIKNFGQPMMITEPSGRLNVGVSLRAALRRLTMLLAKKPRRQRLPFDVRK